MSKVKCEKRGRGCKGCFWYRSHSGGLCFCTPDSFGMRYYCGAERIRLSPGTRRLYEKEIMDYIKGDPSHRLETFVDMEYLGSNAPVLWRKAYSRLRNMSNTELVKIHHNLQNIDKIENRYDVFNTNTY